MITTLISIAFWTHIAVSSPHGIAHVALTRIAQVGTSAKSHHLALNANSSNYRVPDDTSSSPTPKFRPAQLSPVFESRFLEGCRIRSDEPSPMPKKAAEYHWDPEKVTVDSSIPSYDARDSEEYMSGTARELADVEIFRHSDCHEPMQFWEWRQVVDLDCGAHILGEDPAWPIERCDDVLGGEKPMPTNNTQIFTFFVGMHR